MIKKELRVNTLHGSLIRLNKSHRKMAHRKFKEICLTEGKPKLLDFLVSNPGCSQVEIARFCRIEPATATSILSSMENEGLIYRERNPKDKRVLNVFLTEEGIASQKKVEKVFSDLDEICFEGFTEDEKIEAISMINRLYENLAKYREKEE